MKAPVKLILALIGLAALAAACRLAIPRIGEFQFQLLPTDAAVRFGNPTCPTNPPPPKPEL
jgi:hypothetical protein